MEDFSINTTSGDQSFDYSNIYINDTDYNYDDNNASTAELTINVVHWIIVCTGLPLTPVAIAAVYSLVGKDHITPVYMINLLVSDLIQLCCQAAWIAEHFNIFTYCLHIFGLMASVGFMVCISLERYLMITQPLWFRFRRNIKNSVVVCVVVWILPLLYILLLYFRVHHQILETISAIYFILPFPLFIFFLVGTSKALSAARSVPADEKRRIVAILVVVLLIYTLLFLPGIIWFLVKDARNNLILILTSLTLVNISPLADLMLYIFIRKGVVDKLLASLSCCKMSTNQPMISMSNDTSVSHTQNI